MVINSLCNDNCSIKYIVSGMLVEMSPQIFSTQFDVSRPFSSQDFGVAPIKMLQRFSAVQFFSFTLSIIFGAFFVILNVDANRTVSQSSPKK